jgi:DNA polymerase
MEDAQAHALAEAATIDEARAAAVGCRACELWRRGTQTVFGDGPSEARLLLVGEQPGDREDLAGEPFVGPAGRVLDAALADAGIDRDDAYLTNAVKHFKWRPSGKRRIHDKPSWSQIQACRPWLDLELQLVRPEVVVLLGATAAQSLLGRQFRVTRERGRVLEVPFARSAVATVHPSSILRARDAEREAAFGGLVADLEVARRALREPARR